MECTHHPPPAQLDNSRQRPLHENEPFPSDEDEPSGQPQCKRAERGVGAGVPYCLLSNNWEPLQYAPIKTTISLTQTVHHTHHEVVKGVRQPQHAEMERQTKACLATKHTTMTMRAMHHISPSISQSHKLLSTSETKHHKM